MAQVGDASSTEAADAGVFFVSLKWKGSSFSVPVQAEDSLASVFDFAQEALDFPRENCKLIHRGKALRPDHENLSVAEAGLAAGSKLLLMAVSAHDVSFVQSSRPDPLVKGFAEEERDEIGRRKRARAAQASAWGTKQDAEHRFNSIKAEFKYSEPPPYEAEKLLQKLATDPGIIDIMKSRGLEVGILTEMSPVEAQERMAQRGTPNMDLLGYNQNAGEMIVLRLRTDNLKGFRPYHDLINTLIHELTHNVWGPHDDKFWKLYGELKAQYMRFHRFWSHGGQSADGGSGQFQGFAGGDEGEGAESGGFGQKLGGGDAQAADVGSAKSRAAAAAEARLREAAAQARLREASKAAAAEAAAEESSGSAALPDFLAGNGSWIFACPCGQVHNFAGVCSAGAAATAAAAPDVDMGTEGDEGDDATEPVAANEEPDEEAMEEEAPTPQRAWLGRFRGQLASLRAAPEAKEALALLLRLVSNVLERPEEPKFRRVRAENPRIRAGLRAAGAEGLMALLGFEGTQEEGERVFLLRDALVDSEKLRRGQELLRLEMDAREVRCTA